MSTLTKDEMLEVAHATLDRIDHSYITAVMMVAPIMHHQDQLASRGLIAGLSAIIAADPGKLILDAVLLNAALQAKKANIQ